MNAISQVILSAVLLAIPFFNAKLWLFSWIGFIPFFLALENKSLRRPFIISFICGFIFWALTIYWLVHVTLFGTIILISYLSLYFALFGLIIRYCLKHTPYNIILLPGSWVLLEYIRSHLFTGLPWALIGFSQYKNLPVIQIADLTGAWAVSFLIIFINLIIYLALRKQIKLKLFLACVFVLFIVLAYGILKLNQKPLKDPGQKIKISVIQGNIPQEQKWDKRSIDFILNNYTELTEQASGEKPDLVIWPEAAVPGLWGQDDELFMKVFTLAKEQKINLLTGAVSQLGNKYYNSALFIDKTGALAAMYNKLHLVPFGEFIPLKDIFPFLETIAPIGDITPGEEFTIFSQPLEFGVLICFEDLFPELSRRFVKEGAKFLVNITNDAWYKQTSAPYQHFAASVFRAVENRVCLARAANTGISGFIDPYGRILSVVSNKNDKEIFVKGYISQIICPQGGNLTVYNRLGDFFIIFCLLLDACVIIFIIKKKK